MDEIRARYAQGLATIASLAREYKISEQTVARVLREAPSEYGKARRKSDNKYGTSERGRARRRRADKTYSGTDKDKERRAKKYGVTAADIEKIIEQQGNKCPLTGKAITSRSAVDHAHGMVGVDAIRGIVDPQINATLPNDDAGLLQFANKLRAYAGKRVKLHAYLGCRDAYLSCVEASKQ
jgi:hypothetical protein